MSVVCVLVLLFASPTSLAVAAGTRVLSVEPDYGKAGDELVAKGENLGSNSVRKLYLPEPMAKMILKSRSRNRRPR
tara:strand:+ start:103 stop:330 length:228 start_codon:yes stop_codon:yes gene_type:complete